MEHKQQPAQALYEASVTAMRKYCEDHADLEVLILDDTYPLRVVFIPEAQQSLFGNENIDDDGAVNELTVTVGLSTSVKSTLRFKMDAKGLKKLIKMAEQTGKAYYQAYREGIGQLLTPRRPFKKALDGFDVDEASVLVCPNCQQPLDIRCASHTPKHCQECGQSLDHSAPSPVHSLVDDMKKFYSPELLAMYTSGAKMDRGEGEEGGTT